MPRAIPQDPEFLEELQGVKDEIIKKRQTFSECRAIAMILGRPYSWYDYWKMAPGEDGWEALLKTVCALHSSSLCFSIYLSS
mmetsp:Transcript_15225/g.35076  ORF Transcript_15225/g.35076 Transcript_15225/m.35076 type:complete len:82 (+) Transcript_15225:161-406(+)